ncbi:MAG: hypothetical protein WED07_00875 [Candidatus Freyarchaeum deiterrae]
MNNHIFSKGNGGFLEIYYSKHLLQRLEIRKFPQNLPRTVFLEAEKRFIDVVTGHRIAVKKMNYGGKERFIIVAYDILNKGIMIITCHPIEEKQVENRINSGRWSLERE